MKISKNNELKLRKKLNIEKIETSKNVDKNSKNKKSQANLKIF